MNAGISWSTMKLAIVSSALWWAFIYSIHVSAQEIPMDQVSESANFERNTTDDRSAINIQITEYPVGRILLISPEKVFPLTSNTTSIKNTSSSPENADICHQNALNKTIENLRKEVNEISSKVSALESKWERRLSQDVKKSPNVFFVPPKNKATGENERSALEHLRSGKYSADRVEWIIPLSESTTPAPELPPRNLFSKDAPQSSTTSTPQQQIDLLNRAKRRSDRKIEGNNTKPKVLSLCARITPVADKTQNAPLRVRRLKRTRRDVLSGETDGFKPHVMMAKLLRAFYENQEQLNDLDYL